MGLRMLDTGLARDISGVLRITTDADNDTTTSDVEREEKEMLYHVGDGAVEVFHRGQMRS
jgi:elongator complex protein 6